MGNTGNCFSVCYYKNTHLEQFTEYVDQQNVNPSDDFMTKVNDFKDKYKNFNTAFEDMWKNPSRNREEFLESSEAQLYRATEIGVKNCIDDMKRAFTTNEEQKKNIIKKANEIFNFIKNENEEREKSLLE